MLGATATPSSGNYELVFNKSGQWGALEGSRNISAVDVASELGLGWVLKRLPFGTFDGELRESMDVVLPQNDEVRVCERCLEL